MSITTSCNNRTVVRDSTICTRCGNSICSLTCGIDRAVIDNNMIVGQKLPYDIKTSNEVIKKGTIINPKIVEQLRELNIEE